MTIKQPQAGIGEIIKRMHDALVSIRDDETRNPCGCEDHSSQDCCVQTGYHCPECIAGVALFKTQQPPKQPPPLIATTDDDVNC